VGRVVVGADSLWFAGGVGEVHGERDCAANKRWVRRNRRSRRQAQSASCSGRSKRHGCDQEQQQGRSERSKKPKATFDNTPNNENHACQNGTAGGSGQWYGGPNTQDPCDLRLGFSTSRTACKERCKAPPAPSTAPFRPSSGNTRPMGPNASGPFGRWRNAPFRADGDARQRVSDTAVSANRKGSGSLLTARPGTSGPHRAPIGPTRDRLHQRSSRSRER
jgi:hypothetical protein